LIELCNWKKNQFNKIIKKTIKRMMTKFKKIKYHKLDLKDEIEKKSRFL
jgi:hypothetical protein